MVTTQAITVTRRVAGRASTYMTGNWANTRLKYHGRGVIGLASATPMPVMRGPAIAMTTHAATGRYHARTTGPAASTAAGTANTPKSPATAKSVALPTSRIPARTAKGPHRSIGRPVPGEVGIRTSYTS
ncbi:hypothetical protein [Nonomuraea sp. NPDC050643]|uniref:hypothetical protein n=1 Tax=Nonomuraea sp. NPDC050643 TaxID=3155660 RepID=UPI0033CFF36F